MSIFWLVRVASLAVALKGHHKITPMIVLVITKRKVGLETWLRDHHFKRTAFMNWKAAGVKPVKGKVSAAKARAFEEAILQDARELGPM